MTVIEWSLICLGFFLQIFVFLLGFVTGSMASKHWREAVERDKHRKHYEAALRFWHTPQNVSKN
jgi:hypothetical protein